MGPLHQRIQIGEQAVTQQNCAADVAGTAAVHPGFGNGVIRIGRMDGETGLENNILDPAD